MIAVILAAVLLTAGALALYLCAPHQRLLSAPARKPAAWIGAALLAAALALLLTMMGPATAVFTWMTALALLWTIPPVVIGWLRFRRSARP